MTFLPQNLKNLLKFNKFSVQGRGNMIKYRKVLYHISTNQQIKGVNYRNEQEKMGAAYPAVNRRDYGADHSCGRVVCDASHHQRGKEG